MLKGPGDDLRAVVERDVQGHLPDNRGEGVRIRAIVDPVAADAVHHRGQQGQRGRVDEGQRRPMRLPPGCPHARIVGGDAAQPPAVQLGLRHPSPGRGHRRRVEDAGPAGRRDEGRRGPGPRERGGGREEGAAAVADHFHLLDQVVHSEALPAVAQRIRKLQHGPSVWLEQASLGAARLAG